MKTIAIVVFSFVTLGACAKGGSVTCVDSFSASSTGVTTAPCSAIGPFSDLTLTIVESYDTWVSGNPVVNFLGVPVQSSSFFGVTFSCSVITVAMAAVPCVGFSETFAPDPSITSYSIQFTNLSAIVTGGSIQLPAGQTSQTPAVDTVSLTVTLDYTLAAPEPESGLLTVGALGGSLLVGWHLRRRKAAIGPTSPAKQLKK